MKKLNNKGMTIIELLVCFVIVAIVSASIYSTVTNYNTKKDEESYKQEIYKFKNLLTKELYDDIIINGLTSINNYEGEGIFASEPKNVLPNKLCTSGNNYDPKNLKCTNAAVTDDNDIMPKGTKLILLQLNFRDNTTKVLEIATFKNTSKADEIQYPDKYYIAYGPVETNESGDSLTKNDMVRYKLPNLGESTINGKKIPDLSLEITNLSLESTETGGVGINILSLEVRFIHPDLDDKYRIKINAPLNMDFLDRIN